jgi:hypothetical protein
LHKFGFIVNFVSGERLTIAVIGAVEGDGFTSSTGVREVSAGLYVAVIDVGSNVRPAEVDIGAVGFTISAVVSLTSLVSQTMNNETIMMAASILIDIFFASRNLRYPLKLEDYQCDGYFTERC